MCKQKVPEKTFDIQVVILVIRKHVYARLYVLPALSEHASDVFVFSASKHPYLSMSMCVWTHTQANKERRLEKKKVKFIFAKQLDLFYISGENWYYQYIYSLDLQTSTGYFTESHTFSAQ